MTLKRTKDGCPILPEYAHKKIYKQVAEAAAALDETKPGWAHSVRLDNLDMSDPQACILGWAFRSEARRSTDNVSGYGYATDVFEKISDFTERSLDPFGGAISATDALDKKDREDLYMHPEHIEAMDQQADSAWMEAWAHEVKTRRTRKKKNEQVNSR